MLRKFKDNFLFGTAISAFQTEMGHNKESISENSDWYLWTHDEYTKKLNYVSGDLPEDGPDFWDRYKEYIDNAVYMNNNSIRLGIDWARIFKNSTENISVNYKENDKNDIYDVEFNDNIFNELNKIADNNAVNHYKEIFSYIKSKNIKILLTLYHWPLPLWIHDPIQCNKDITKTDKTGWLNKKTVLEFAKYTYFIYKEFNGYIDIWHTINEPNIIAINGYLYGNLENFPPGLSDYDYTIKVLRNLAYAHNIAYKTIKNINKNAYVGINIAMPYFEPEKNDENNIFINNYVNYLSNELYLDSALYVNFDNSLSGIFDESRPYEFSGTDFIGIDYYNRIKVRYVNNDYVDIRLRYAFLPCSKCSDNYWDIYPEGIRKVSNIIFNKYHKPIIIMENGVADADDKFRYDFIKDHLIEIHKAIKIDNVHIKGYYHWSLMDNYEWVYGFKYKFGLYKIENNNIIKTRAVDLYKDICSKNGVEDESYTEYY